MMRRRLPDRIDADKLARIVSQNQGAIAAQMGNARPAWRGSRLDERSFRNFNPPHRHGDTEIRGGWATLQARIREMVENDPQMKRPTEVLVTMICGKGPLVLAKAMLPSRDPQRPIPRLDYGFNFASDLHWERWTKRKDVRFKQICRTAVREWVNTGVAILKRYRLKDGPPCWQIIESEQLNRFADRPREGGANEISNGIEYAEDGVTPVAFHILKAHPADGHAMQAGFESERVPAEEVLYLYLPHRASARFGIPFHQAMMRSAADGDFLVGTELTSAAVAALFSVVITTAEEDLPEDEMQLSDGGPNTDAHGNYFTKLGAGTVGRLRPGEGIQQIAGNRPNTKVSEFLKFLWLLNSQATNLSYHRMTGDVAGASYTALRAAMLDDEAYITPLQEAFFEAIVEPMRRDVDEWGVATGAIPIPARKYIAERERYQQWEIVGPGQDWLQPDDEVAATKEAIGAGLSSLPYEAARWGRHWLQNLREQSMAMQAAADLGVTLDFSKGNGGRPEEADSRIQKRARKRREAS